ncbi:hypothetical protein ABTX81_04835 [Kitasatospora sp. NPDC097605]|uniref:hypothetical protein n=1 Tax=Kitasatospora sp. NPDC097605 TaxID=3157226 RepID=UPI00332FF286
MRPLLEPLDPFDPLDPPDPFEPDLASTTTPSSVVPNAAFTTVELTVGDGNGAADGEDDTVGEGGGGQAALPPPPSSSWPEQPVSTSTPATPAPTIVSRRLTPYPPFSYVPYCSVSA